MDIEKRIQAKKRNRGKKRNGVYSREVMTARVNAQIPGTEKEPD